MKFSWWFRKCFVLRTEEPGEKPNFIWLFRALMMAPWPQPSEGDSLVFLPVSPLLVLLGSLPWSTSFPLHLLTGTSFSISCQPTYLLGLGLIFFSITRHNFFSTIWSYFFPSSLRVHILWLQYLNKTVQEKVCSMHSWGVLYSSSVLWWTVMSPLLLISLTLH